LVFILKSLFTIHMAKSGVFKTIKDRDKSITPFKVYKSWEYSTTSSLQLDNISRFAAIKPNPKSFNGSILTLDSQQYLNDSSSALINSSSQKEAGLYWYSIDHLYYKRAGVPYDVFGNSNQQNIYRTLYPEASIISIPQARFGETIRPESIELRLRNSQLNAVSMSLYDDGNGNLIDSSLSSSISNELIYLTINSMRYASNWTNNTSIALNTDTDVTEISTETVIPDLIISAKNVWITNNSGYNIGSINWGEAAAFSDNSYIRIPTNDRMNFEQDDNYSIAFWATLPSTISTKKHLLTKRSTGLIDRFNPNTRLLVHGDFDTNSSQYPFDMYIDDAGTGLPAVVCNYKTSGQIASVQYSASLADTANLNHFVFQKTGSVIELYFNGQLQSSASVPAGNIQNQADIFIGSLGLDSSGNGKDGYYGYIREFLMFNKSLTQTEITQLTHTGSNLMSTNRNIVGNVFCEHGIVVLSDPRPKYGTEQYRMFADQLINLRTNTLEPSYLDEFYLEFNSTKTLYEHEYICKMRGDEFNFTMNPTIRKNNNPGSEFPKSFVALDEFAPYITTVGLYNDKGQLLAIGKLGTPIRKRDDVDLNIIVRFDA